MTPIEEIQAARDTLTEWLNTSGYGVTENGWLYQVTEESASYQALGPGDDPRQPMTQNPFDVAMYETVEDQLKLLEYGQIAIETWRRVSAQINEDHKDEIAEGIDSVNVDAIGNVEGLILHLARTINTAAARKAS